MKSNPKKLQQPKISVHQIVEDIFGCKWSLRILELIQQGVHRPGAMERKTEGLTAKVLNERLKKLIRHGLLQRHDFAEIPPRVEYHLTIFGQKLSSILEQLRQLEKE